jgi:hypothetical protein
LRGRYDDAERSLLGGMVDGTDGDPDGVLSAIDAYRTVVRCVRCYRVQEAEALGAVGRLQEARDAWLRVATQFETNFTVSLLERARAWERVGHLSEEIDDPATAVDGYRHFVEMWADADPELQPRVQAARDRLRALESS